MKFHAYWCYGYCVTRLQQEGEEEKHGQNGRTIFCYNFGQKWYFSERFSTQLMCCAVKSLKVEIESKNCISKCMGRIQIP